MIETSAIKYWYITLGFIFLYFYWSIFMIFCCWMVPFWPSWRKVDFQWMGLEGFCGQPLGPNFPSPWANMLALRLDFSTAALTRKFYPSENWLSSRFLTSVIVRELVFPSWHQPLTIFSNEYWSWNVHSWIAMYDNMTSRRTYTNFRDRSKLSYCSQIKLSIAYSQPD